MRSLIEYRQDFKETVASIENPVKISPGIKGLIIGTLNRYCRGDYNRKQFLKALTGYSSSKDLTDAEWEALCWFLDPEDEGVLLSKYGELEIDRVIASAMPEQEKLL
jgi:hypothetical protein